MAELTLFDAEPIPAPVQPKLSADARRTVHQRHAIERGVHPLSLSPHVPNLALHRDAAKVTHASQEGEGLRCGGCRFRTQLGHNARTYAKCLWPGERPKRGWPRLTHGPGTDVRAWWPACTSYEPSEAS